MPLKPDLSEFAKIGILSGLVGGFVLGILLCFWNVPLILEAEILEAKSPNIAGSHVHSHSHGETVHSHSSISSPETFQKSEDLLHRNLWTVLGSLLLGLAFGILISLWLYFLAPVDFFDLSSVPKTALFSFLLGLSGFLIFFGIPALGLPPELPGRAAAASDYEIRQSWWYLCVGSSFFGFTTFSLVRSFTKIGNTKRWILGITLLLLSVIIPFLYGVPRLEETSLSPENLRLQFKNTTWATNFIFWIVLSLSSLFILRKKLRVVEQPENI